MMAWDRSEIPVRRLCLVAATVPGIVWMGSTAADPPRVEPGEWRITWNMESIKGRQGIPPEFLDLQTVTERRCLDRVPVLPLPPGQDRGCQIELESAAAETIHWRGTCKATTGQTHQVSGTIQYRGLSLDGALSIYTGTVHMDFVLRGRQVSPTCL